MKKRIKKPAVKPEVCRQWLRRFEEEGESPPQIAKADGYDVRTVRKQIELAKEEREVREARATVLRQALEKHYVDLCAFAQKIDSEISWPPRKISIILTEDRLWRALKEHLPKSPIWKAAQKRDELVMQYESCIEQVKERVKAEAESRGFRFATTVDDAGLGSGVKESAVFHVVSLARGHKGLKDVSTFSQKEYGDTGLYEVRFGAYGLGLVPADDASRLKEAYGVLLDEAVEWDESIRLRQVVLELERQLSILREELATITLRRIVPGRCRYCPL